jgi:hypothetical protein
MAPSVTLTDDDLMIFLCSSENAPTECKSILNSSSVNVTEWTPLTILPTLTASSTSPAPSGLSMASFALHEVLPYIIGGCVLLFIYLMSVLLLRFAAKMSWLHAVSLALALVFKGEGRVCCVCHQVNYALGDGAVVPQADPEGAPQIDCRQEVQPDLIESRRRASEIYCNSVLIHFST